MHAGSTFEEYVVLADYESTSDSGVSVKIGDMVKVISREDTGETACMSELVVLKETLITLV